MSNKREKFKEIAGKRVQFVLGKLDQLGKCSNRNNYDYSEEDVKKMFSAIRKSLRACELRYEDELKKGEIKEFKF